MKFMLAIQKIQKGIKLLFFKIEVKRDYKRKVQKIWFRTRLLILY